MGKGYGIGEFSVLKTSIHILKIFSAILLTRLAYESEFSGHESEFSGHLKTRKREGADFLARALVERSPSDTPSFMPGTLTEMLYSLQNG
ncbi:MAG: hypothetical protein MUF49_03455 [Oculatellaceae cyanobacterium Prado106]|jgi:hypothetical protein|nr:hypothetical protein [Oculatellaceae cyanobacterium Prado106]